MRSPFPLTEGALVLGAFLLVGCSASAGPGANQAGTPPATLAPTPSAAPSDILNPTATAAGSPGGCVRPTPTRVTMLRLEPVRVVATVGLTSDGSRLTVGARNTTAVARPDLTGPVGTVVADAEVVRQTANLLSADRAVRLLLAPLESPDHGLTTAQPPYDRVGRFVVYTTTRRLTAEITMTCDGRPQSWRLTGEADAGVGHVSCSGSSSEVNRPAGTPAAQVYAQDC